MTFKKGTTFWVGRKHTEESRRKMSQSRKGRGISEEWRKKISDSNKGRKFTEDHKHKIAEASRKYRHTEETKKKMSKIALERSPETKEKMSQSHMGHIPWNKGTKGIQISGNKGKHLSEETKKKISDNHGMRGKIPWNKDKRGVQIAWNKGIKLPNQSGEKNSRWKGGRKVVIARRAGKRRLKGFTLITTNNPYSEPIEYHHIHPNLPYVVPCPTRIHKMFPGGDKFHYQNVNMMLGIIKIDMDKAI